MLFIAASQDTLDEDTILSSSCFSNGVISIDYVKSKENIVDPLTKGLPRDKVQYMARRMGLKSIIWTFWIEIYPCLLSQDLGSIGKLVGEVHICKHTYVINVSFLYIELVCNNMLMLYFIFFDIDE